MVVGEYAHLRAAEVGVEGRVLTDDDAVAIGAGREVARFHEGGHVAVLHGGEGAVVQAAPQVVAQGRDDRGGLASEQIREEIEVVDAVGLGHPHVGARPLEAREAARAVAHACRRAKKADDYCNRAQRELGRRSWRVDRRGGDLEAVEREEIRRKGRRIEPGAALGARVDEPESTFDES